MNIQDNLTPAGSCVYLNVLSLITIGPNSGADVDIFSKILLR